MISMATSGSGFPPLNSTFSVSSLHSIPARPLALSPTDHPPAFGILRFSSPCVEHFYLRQSHASLCLIQDPTSACLHRKVTENFYCYLFFSQNFFAYIILYHIILNMSFFETRFCCVVQAGPKLLHPFALTS
jgi:hypothetical protein